MMRSLAIFAAFLALFGLSFATAMPLGAIAGCANITQPGSYYLVNSVSGAPYQYGSNDYACILVNASNVVLDCKGYTIYVGNASYPAGIALTNVSNVAVKNCNIVNMTSASYPVGINLVGVTQGNFTNNSIDNLYYGIWGGMADVPNTYNSFSGNEISDASFGVYWPSGSAANGYSSFVNNTLTDINLSGFGQAFYETSGYNTYTGNVVDVAGDGFEIAGPHNNLTFNEVTGLTNYNYAFLVHDSDYNYLANNSAHDNLGYGFYFRFTNHSTAIGNTAVNNSYDGFTLDDGMLFSNAVLRDNYAERNGNGFTLLSTDNNLLVNNTAYNNSNDGFMIADLGGIPLSHNNLTANFANFNGNNGFELDNTDNNILRDNTANNNSEYGYYVTAGFRGEKLGPIVVDTGGNNTLVHNYAFGNYYGFYVYGSLFNILTNNTAVNNSNGYRLDGPAYNNTLTHNLAWNQLGEALPNVCYWVGGDFNTLTANNATGCFRGYRVYGSNETLTGNTAQDGPSTGSGDAYGFYLSTFGSVLTNNTAFDNYGTGFYMDDYNGPSADNVLSNNTAYGNVVNGFWLYDSEFNALSGNTAHGNEGDGFLVEDYLAVASYNNLTGNTAYSNTNGFHLSRADNERLDNNTAYGNFNDGFLVDSGQGFAQYSYNNLTNNLGYLNGNYGFELVGEDNNLLENNTAYNNTFGFGLQPNYQSESYSDDNTLIGNTAKNNSLFGFYLYDAYYNYLENNTAHDNGEHGIYMDWGASYNTFVSTASYNNGFGESVPKFNADINVEVSRPIGFGQGSGVYVQYSADYNNFTGLYLYNNSFAGVEEYAVDSYNNFTNVETHGQMFGVFLLSDHGETFTNLTAHDNTVAGLYEGTCSSPAVNIQDSMFYNNAWEVMQTSSCSVPFVMNNTLFGRPYPRTNLNLTIVDEIGSGGGGYNLNDTVAPGLPPANMTSFYNKYLKVNFTGDLGVNTTTFHWTEYEAASFNESSIALYTWTGEGWILTPNQTLDVGNHSLTVLNLTNQYGDDTYGLFGISIVPVISGGNNPTGGGSLQVGLGSNCSGNTVTVTSSGPIQGADVVVNGNSVGTTDSSGQVTFPGCGRDVIIRASRPGYDDGTLSTSLVACGQCVPVTCVNDSGCALDQRCQINAQNASLNQCVPLQCGCGQTADNHQCVGTVWQCGPACNVCPSGQACNADHRCVPTGCTSDLQCKDNEVCRTASGAPGTAAAPGSCQNVTGQCGYASNHAFVPYNYTCGTEPGCPSCPNGQNCVAHQCVQNDITCPSSVVVGSQANCQLTENNQACGPNDNCSAVITSPDGTQTTVPPDEAGNVLLGANITGKYKVTLEKNGVAVKDVYVDVVPKSQQQQGGQQAGAGGPDLLSLVWLLVLLLIVIGAVIYWRSRGGKRK